MAGSEFIVAAIHLAVAASASTAVARRNDGACLYPAQDWTEWRQREHNEQRINSFTADVRQIAVFVV
jgi:hypothetical protein